MPQLQRTSASHERSGVAAVECAIVAPVLLAMVFGMIEITRVYDTQNMLEIAAREGARFASMDRSNMMQTGQSANEKMIQDIKNFLATSGLDPSTVTVDVFEHDSNTIFDIGDPANNLELFRLEVSVPYVEITSYAALVGRTLPTNLSSSMTFRNGRSLGP